MKFGFNQQKASDLVAQHSDDKLRKSVVFVQARIEQKSSPPLDSPAVYFRWTLKQGSAAAQDLQLQQSSQKKAAGKRDVRSLILEFYASFGAFLAHFAPDRPLWA